MRNVAGSIGTAYLSTVMQSQSASNLITYLQRLSLHNLSQINLTGIPSVFGITSSTQLTSLVGELQQIAFEHGTQAAFVVAAIISVLGFLSVLFIGKKKPPLELAQRGGRSAALME